jgi:hypothetical protein
VEDRRSRLSSPSSEDPRFGRVGGSSDFDLWELRVTRIFQWNENKARSNEAMHGISFEEAETVFDDPLGRIDLTPIILMMRIENLSSAIQAMASCSW